MSQSFTPGQWRDEPPAAQRRRGSECFEPVQWEDQLPAAKHSRCSEAFEPGQWAASAAVGSYSSQAGSNSFQPSEWDEPPALVAETDSSDPGESEGDESDDESSAEDVEDLPRSNSRWTASLGEDNWFPGKPGAPRQDVERAGQLDQYQLRGMDPDRVDKVIRSKKSCCRCAGRNCHRTICPKRLLAVCKQFWTLRRDERAHMLRSIYYAEDTGVEEGSGDEHPSALWGRAWNRTWHLCGRRTCLANFAYLLGTTQRSIWKCIYATPDGRSGEISKRHVGATSQRLSLDWWFWELYNSAAEPLPADPSSKRTCSDGLPDGKVCTVWVEHPWLQGDAGDSEVAEGNEDSVDLGTLGKDAGLWRPDLPPVEHLSSWTVAAAEAKLVVGLSRRYLHYITLPNLFWLFCASWEAIRAHLPATLSDLSHLPEPSFKTFKGRWRYWSRYLRIRPKSAHAQCRVCWKLQETMADRTASWTERMGAARELRSHHHQQNLDRTIYWSLRWASRARKNVLCIIIDSMDKSKFVYPRWPFSRTPDDIKTCHRPKLVCTAAIAHGYCKDIYIADETQFHGGSAFIEVLFQT